MSATTGADEVTVAAGGVAPDGELIVAGDTGGWPTGEVVTTGGGDGDSAAGCDDGWTTVGGWAVDGAAAGDGEAPGARRAGAGAGAGAGATGWVAGWETVATGSRASAGSDQPAQAAKPVRTKEERSESIVGAGVARAGDTSMVPIRATSLHVGVLPAVCGRFANPGTGRSQAFRREFVHIQAGCYVGSVSLLPLGLLAVTTVGVRAIEPSVFDVAVDPSAVRYVETRHTETVIRGRPWIPHPRLATVRAGTRLAVRGEVASRDNQGCDGKSWYAVLPIGFVCSVDVRKTERPPSATLAPSVEPGRRLPYRYARVRSDTVPVYDSATAIRDGTPDGLLAKGMSLAIAEAKTIDDQRFLVTTAGKWVHRDDVGWMGEGSSWRGVRIRGEFVGPSFAWVRVDKTPVRSGPDPDAAVLRKVDRRERVRLLEHNGRRGRAAMWRVDESGWVAATQINEVVLREPPPGVVADSDGDDRWVDVDVGEQVLVAYRGRTPVFATLISSGRAHPTPLGNYPIWAKVTDMKMGNQAYEDKAYLVEGVPWVLLFQGHNALHGAYWHDSFGVRKSHGCVNLSPHDARWMFDWALPAMLDGWTGFLPAIDRSITVHVHDSHETGEDAFRQERPIGPPDREQEALRLEEAEARRALEAPPDPTYTPSLDEVLSGIQGARRQPTDG